MKTSIREAGFETGVHRATLHRWLKAGRLKKDKKGFVDIGSIVRLKDESKTGRRAGYAYPDHVRRDVKESGTTLTRALILIAHVVDSLPSEKRRWVCEKILPQFANEGALAGILQENETPAEHPTFQALQKEKKKKAEPKTTVPEGCFPDIWAVSKSRNPNPKRLKSKAMQKALAERKSETGPSQGRKTRG